MQLFGQIPGRSRAIPFFPSFSDVPGVTKACFLEVFKYLKTSNPFVTPGPHLFPRLFSRKEKGYDLLVHDFRTKEQTHSDNVDRMREGFEEVIEKLDRKLQSVAWAEIFFVF